MNAPEKCDFFPVPIFSATHSDAQANLGESTKTCDPFNEFETAVHRLGQFRRGYSGDGSEEEGQHYTPNRVLGFSSRFDGKLAELAEAEIKEKSEAEAMDERGVELHREFQWKANYKEDVVVSGVCVGRNRRSEVQRETRGEHFFFLSYDLEHSYVSYRLNQ